MANELHGAVASCNLTGGMVLFGGRVGSVTSRSGTFAVSTFVNLEVGEHNSLVSLR